MGSIEDKLLVPIEEATVNLTDTGRDCLMAEKLLTDAARMLRAPDRSSEQERLAIVRQIEAYLEGEIPNPFSEKYEYEPGSQEEWP